MDRLFQFNNFQEYEATRETIYYFVAFPHIAPQMDIMWCDTGGLHKLKHICGLRTNNKAKKKKWEEGLVAEW